MSAADVPPQRAAAATPQAQARIDPRPSLLLAGMAALCAAMGFAAGAWARYQLVEVDGLEAVCQEGLSTLCTVRALVIEAFQHHRLSWAAAAFLGLAGLASAWRPATAGRAAGGAWATVALLAALTTASLGLVLYDVDRSAAWWVLSALWLRMRGRP